MPIRDVVSGLYRLAHAGFVTTAQRRSVQVC
jgi:hypothetical protein